VDLGCEDLCRIESILFTDPADPARWHGSTIIIPKANTYRADRSRIGSMFVGSDNPDTRFLYQTFEQTSVSRSGLHNKISAPGLPVDLDVIFQQGIDYLISVICSCRQLEILAHRKFCIGDRQ